MSKLKIGVDINEVLRASWIQFDRYYIEEFGEEGAPAEKPYVYNYFDEYKFVDTVETVKEMREPEDTPENISPIDYQVDENGEAPADAFIFKQAQKVPISAKEIYNRFLYQDFLFEIFGSAPMMYKNMDVYVNKFLEQYQNTAEFTIVSVENKFSIPPTLFFLSKISTRFRNYKFYDDSLDMWNDVDVLITTDPKILKIGAPWGKKLIKIIRPYNENIKAGSIEVKQVADLIDNQEFEKIIKYKK